jgi:hypothetical protein
MLRSAVSTGQPLLNSLYQYLVGLGSSNSGKDDSRDALSLKIQAVAESKPRPSSFQYRQV